ncbi:MAG TPA: hypothetical protein DCE81_14055 [Cytophagales bacterium]|nr:hypothetical protein [Cytophagales bacterium]
MRITSLKNALTAVDFEKAPRFEEALEFIRQNPKKTAIRHLIRRLKITRSADVRNSIALVLSDLKAQVAVPALITAIKDPANVGQTGTLMFALQQLDCEKFFMDFIDVLIHGNYENREMALNLIEKYHKKVKRKVVAQSIAKIDAAKSELANKLDFLDHTTKVLTQL